MYIHICAYVHDRIACASLLSWCNPPVKHHHMYSVRLRTSSADYCLCRTKSYSPEQQCSAQSRRTADNQWWHSCHWVTRSRLKGNRGPSTKQASPSHSCNPRLDLQSPDQRKQSCFQLARTISCKAFQLVDFSGNDCSLLRLVAMSTDLYLKMLKQNKDVKNGSHFFCVNSKNSIKFPREKVSWSLKSTG